jgi:hypothetical protein
MDSYEVSPLQAGWLELLERYQWQWFVTLTFREAIHPEAADKLFRVWISKLNRHLYGVKWYKKQDQGVYWVRALELQKRGVIHFHALLADVKDLNHSALRFYWKNEWYKLGGIAHIEEPASVEHCSRYVSKYVAKEGELECSPNLRSYARIDVLSREIG